MSQNIFDKCIYNRRFAFGFDFQHVNANIPHVTRHGVARRNAADRFAKEYALDDPADFEISSLAHGGNPGS